jgi:hypothetical protein
MNPNPKAWVEDPLSEGEPNKDLIMEAEEIIS